MEILFGFMFLLFIGLALYILFLFLYEGKNREISKRELRNTTSPRWEVSTTHISRELTPRRKPTILFNKDEWVAEYIEDQDDNQS